MEALVDAVYEVIKDVALQDSKLIQEAGGAYTQTRKTFVAGQSLGGFTAAYVCLCVSFFPSNRDTGHETDGSLLNELLGNTEHLWTQNYQYLNPSDPLSQEE